MGHCALPTAGRLMAAVLACARLSALHRVPVASEGDGDDSRVTPLEHWGAAVSHRSAAVLWDLLPDRAGLVEVTVRGDGGRVRRPGLRIHRAATLDDREVTLRSGIPVTTPARTIADLRRAAAESSRRGGVTAAELRRAVREAAVLGLPLGEERDERTRSELERRFLRICRRHGLPPPEVNVRVGPYLVDFLWAGARLVVECDGYRYHRGRAAFEEDRGRDLELRRRGYAVLRLSARQLEAESPSVVEVIRRAVGRAP